MQSAVLSIVGLEVNYGGIQAVQGVSFDVYAGRAVGLLGRNGAGKSTTLKAIKGVAPSKTGDILFNGMSILGAKTHKISRAGIAYVPETRGIFPSLSVKENLLIAQRHTRSSEASKASAWSLERVFQLFPRLSERLENGGTQRSGGEQQMLSIARALLTNPDILLLDEPSEGLAPVMLNHLQEALIKLKQTGISMLLVEQNLNLALSLADSVVVLGKGRIQWQGDPNEFREAVDIKEKWLLG